MLGVLWLLLQPKSAQTTILWISPRDCDLAEYITIKMHLYMLCKHQVFFALLFRGYFVTSTVIKRSKNDECVRRAGNLVRY